MKPMTMAALVSLSLAGCAGPLDPSAEFEAVCTPGAPGCPRLPKPGEESQGRSLSGDVFAEGMSIRSTSVTIGSGVATAAAVLRGTLVARVNGAWVTGADLKGAIMTALPPGGTPVKLRIDSVTPSSAETDGDTYLPTVDPSGGTQLYEVSYFDANAVAHPLCNPDFYGSTKAVVMPLWYDAKGTQWMGQVPSSLPAPVGNTPSAKAFAFACLSGVSAKCYKWGYMPWLQPDATQPMQVAGVHWACTRAARADYCGDGTTHTYDNTPVNLWDNVAPQQIRIDDVNPWTNPLGGIVVGNAGVATRFAARTVPVTQPNQFEGGWSTRGAMCLSHLRWNSMPNNLCPDRTHAPFEHYEQVDGTGWIEHFCDNEQEAITLANNMILSGWSEIIPPRIFLESDLNAVLVPQTWPPPVAVVGTLAASAR